MSEIACFIYRLVASISGAASLHGTVDYGYGAPQCETPVWSAIELNGKAPYLLGHDKHKKIAETLRTLFSDQIAETVAHPKAVN